MTARNFAIWLYAQRIKGLPAGSCHGHRSNRHQHEPYSR